MSYKFRKLTSANMKALLPGQRLTENGIVFERLPNGRARFKIETQANGQRIHRVFGWADEPDVNLAAVMAEIEKLRTDARCDRLDLPKGRKMALIFEQAVEGYLERLGETDGKDIPKKTQRFKKHLIPFFKGKVLEKITEVDLGRYRSHRKQLGAAPATINCELGVLSHLMNKAIDWGWIKTKPRRMGIKKVSNARLEWLTTEECKNLIEAARAESTMPGGHSQIYPFIVIALSTGMRRNEILSIRIADVYLEHNFIRLPKTKTGEDNQFITPELAEFLRGHIANLPPDSEWLFPCLGTRKSKTGHTVMIDEPFKRVVKVAGLEGRNICRHTLRHTVGAHLSLSGVELKTKMAIMRHKTPIMSLRYDHFTAQHVIKSMQKLGNIFEGNPTRSPHDTDSDKIPSSLEATGDKVISIKGFGGA